MAGALTAYLHYLAMISLAALLILQLTLCVQGLSEERVRLLVRLNHIYLGAGLLALVSGLVYLIWLGKEPAFYLHNPVFYLKLALFAALGLISIPPTLQYLRWLHGIGAGPYRVADYQVMRMRRHILAELLLIAIIPLMASFTARGIGIQTVAQ